MPNPSAEAKKGVYLEGAYSGVFSTRGERVRLVDSKEEQLETFLVEAKEGRGVKVEEGAMEPLPLLMMDMEPPPPKNPVMEPLPPKNLDSEFMICFDISLAISVLNLLRQDKADSPYVLLAILVPINPYNLLGRPYLALVNLALRPRTLHLG